MATQKGHLDIDLPGVYFICGLQGGGKSHLIRYIMSESRDKFDVGLVFTNTGFQDGNFDYIADRGFIHAEYDERVLTQFKAIFAKRIQEGKPLRGFVIFDDCMEGKQWRSKPFRTLVTQVRHYGITVIISTQHVTAIDVMFRNNTWKIFMFAMPSKNAMNALYEGFGQMFDSYEAFKTFYLEAVGKKHHFLIYDVRNGGTTIESRYTVAFCPKNIPPFKVGPMPRGSSAV